MCTCLLGQKWIKVIQHHIIIAIRKKNVTLVDQVCQEISRSQTGETNKCVTSKRDSHDPGYHPSSPSNYGSGFHCPLPKPQTQWGSRLSLQRPTSPRLRDSGSQTQQRRVRPSTVQQSSPLALQRTVVLLWTDIAWCTVLPGLGKGGLTDVEQLAVKNEKLEAGEAGGKHLTWALDDFQCGSWNSWE